MTDKPGSQEKRPEDCRWFIGNECCVGVGGIPTSCKGPSNCDSFLDFNAPAPVPSPAEQEVCEGCGKSLNDEEGTYTEEGWFCDNCYGTPARAHIDAPPAEPDVEPPDADRVGEKNWEYCANGVQKRCKHCQALFIDEHACYGTLHDTIHSQAQTIESAKEALCNIGSQDSHEDIRVWVNMAITNLTQGEDDE